MHRRSSALEGTFDECRTRRAHKRVLLPVHEGNEAADRGVGESPKDPSTYATAYCRFMQNFAKVKKKRDTKVALRGIHVACLLIMFFRGRLAMPCMRRENVRHATLLFCAKGVNVRTTGAEKRLKKQNGRDVCHIREI